MTGTVGMNDTMPSTNSVLVALARLETKMDSVLMSIQEIHKRVDELDSDNAKLAERVVKLEMHTAAQTAQLHLLKWLIGGVGSLVVIAVTYFAKGAH